ncbi:MAG: ATP-binding protein [Anaerolineae bacterium]
MKVLIIDQDSHVLEMLQITLTRAGYTVLIAADGNAGFRLARTEQPALVVLDLMLPGIDGVELCQKLKQEPSTKTIPIFLITALSVPAANEPWRPTPQAKWQLLHYHAHLPKPLDLNQFLRQVESLLKPGRAAKPQTGPRVLVFSTDEPFLRQVKVVLQEQDFYVHTYSAIVKPFDTMRAHPPAALVIEEGFLSPEVWQAFDVFRQNNPTFALVVLQREATAAPPNYLDRVDGLVAPPFQPWQVARIVRNALHLHNAQERTKTLSQQVLTLNSELVDSQHVLTAQNEELDLINRRLLRLGELKETLTGMLVHDLKAPLSAMMGALQFLTMDPENTISEGSRKIVNGGLAAGRQMERLTITLLDEQKLENNRLVFDIEPTDLQETLNTSLELMGPLFSMHRVSIDVNVPPDTPPLKADPIILQRIIENLLDNAVKYSPVNETITVAAALKGDMVEICIADRGDGIPPEHREVIFERFTQLDNPAVEKIRGGVGLGLTFCKLAVETMGGKIWIDSLDNVGAAFFFTLPVMSGPMA